MPLKKGQAPESFKSGKLQKKDLRSRTPEERKKISQMGVEARIESNKRKKEMKEQLRALLELDVTKAADKKKLRELGINENDMCNQTLLMVALFKKGLQGDVSAIKQINDMMNDVGLVEQQTQAPVINIISTKAKVSKKGNDVNIMEYDEDDDW